jgi:hypothetical protein
MPRRKTIKLLKAALSCHDIKLQQSLDILQTTHNQALQQPPPQQQPAAVRAVAPAAALYHNNSKQCLQRPRQWQRQQGQQPTTVLVLANQRCNVNEALRNTPCLPPIYKRECQSQLCYFKLPGGPAEFTLLLLCYEKQLYLMRYIRNKMDINGHNKDESAAAVDLLRVELGIKTVDKFLKHLKLNDQSVVGWTY